MAGYLTDDGTMDTVIRCSECGREQRYTFDPAMPDTIDDVQEDYESFVDWCIEDFEDTHECPRYSVQTWFERDRAHVALYYGINGDANDTLVVEWWDKAVSQAIEDGFLDPRDYLGSALEYARSVGLAKKAERIYFDDFEENI